MGRGESTGYNNVDELYSVVTGQLTVVTGHPSSGKSEFIDQIMVNLAQSKGWKFAICSFENEPRIHIAKLISKHLRKPFFDGPSPAHDKRRNWVAEKNLFSRTFLFSIRPTAPLSSVDSIIERLKVAVLRHGVRGAIIDPYNYIQKGRDVSETDWVSDVLTKLRVFAQAHGIHLWFVAHPTKMMRDQTGKVPAPKGYDISGSAAWFAKADVGLTVHRPDPANSIALRDPTSGSAGSHGSASRGTQNSTSMWPTSDIQDTCPRSIPRYQHTSRGTPWVQRR
jgi:twinkle protein